MSTTELNDIQRLLLQLLRGYLFRQTFQSADLPPEITDQTLAELLRVAKRHHIMPMVVDALTEFELCARSPLFLQAKMSVLRQTAACVVRRQAFMELMANAADAGFHPLVVKGTASAGYYPSPACRLSSDEDLLVQDDEKDRLCEWLQAEGFVRNGDEGEGVTAYHRRSDGLLLEVHTSLFPATAVIYRTMNGFFAKVHEHPVMIERDGMCICTLPPTEYLLYLVCHAFKHFIHGGIGIRQFCDGLLYLSVHADEIDWKRLLSALGEIHAEIFLINLLAIGEQYFNIRLTQVDLSSYGPLVDPDELLCDLLDAGIYGNDRGDRLHSGAMTAQAVTHGDQRNGRTLLFPSVSALKGRYPCLKKHPYLLPWVWCVRGCGYLKKLFRSRDASPAEILDMGNARLQLLRKYKILEK